MGSDGQITRVVDLSTMFVPPDNWQGATGIAYQGNFYTGALGTFPVRPGTQCIYKITPSGNVTAAASGLTAVTGVAFDAQGRLYALETDTVAGEPGPASAGSGQVVRVNGDGTLTTVATGLTFPTAMTFGPDGALYVSNNGFGIPVAGAGQIVRVTVAVAGAPVVSASASGTSASFTVSFTSKAPGQGCSGLVEVGTRDAHAGTTSHTVTVSGNDLPGTIGDNGIQPGATYNYELVTITSNGTEVDKQWRQLLQRDDSDVLVRSRDHTDRSRSVSRRPSSRRATGTRESVFSGEAGPDQKTCVHARTESQRPPT
ncbi:MAG TPA: ScyD/ScyE family protein [Dehalococcoidia bacterium]